MSLEELIAYIRLNSEKEIYDKYLLGQEVWYFQENIKGEDPLLYYDKFKRFISAKLNIPFNNISIIGSAKTKFSFSPDNNFRPFNENSDFDIVLVSSELFNKYWLAFYAISQEQYLHDYSYMTSGIFRKFISLKDSDRHYDNQELIDWQVKLMNFKTQLQLEYKIYCDINYRIYADWQFVESYHLKGIKKLKDKLNETN